MIADTKALAASPVRRLSHPLITERHLQRAVINYVRQSSVAQVRDHWGSTNLQEEQVRWALEYGWTPDQIITIR